MRIIIYISALVAMTVADKENVDDILASANQRFSADMFSEVTKNNPGKSVVLSAFSVLSPLAQLALASEGESHDELLQTIGLPNDDVSKEVFANLTLQLRSVNGVELKMANRIYVAQSAELNNQFASVSRDVFGSDFKNVNFADSALAATEINTWVEEQTNKRIKDLVKSDSLNAATAAVLVNAIYFKGTWKKGFNKEATKDRDFYVSKDTTVKIPTMHTTEDYKYGESAELGAKLLELPYKGEESSLVVILPNEIDGLAALVEKIKSKKDAVTEALKNMYSFEVKVYLPKFKIETEINLKDVLENMGVRKLFTPQAKLNKLLKNTSESLYVSEAIQKAFIEVNEEGTEAAASNDIKLQLRSSFVKPVTFNANRPFYFAVRSSGTDCFSGIYVE